MKTIFNEYYKIVMYVLFGILLVMSSYLIILNINHYQSLLDTTVVSEADNDYLVYKKNVNLIEETINKLNESNEKEILSKVLDKMKLDGVYRLIPKTVLIYKDLYSLNDYFIEELINNSWISNVKKIENSNKHQDTIMLLVNNSNYLNSIFINNSLILADNGLDNKIEDNYHFILSNYLTYSKVILSICNELGGFSG